MNRPIRQILPLNGINTEDNAECYPYVTSNGLHLYYTKSVEYMDVVCFAERKNLNEAFIDKGPIVLPERSYDQLSCWVSANELQLLFVSRGDGLPDHDTIFLSERGSIDKPFVKTNPIILEIETEIELICAASLTPDGKQLFVSINQNDENQFLQFERREGNTFSYVKTLPVPKKKNLHVGSGKLSPDGLRFYTDITHGDAEKANATYQIACYRRTTVSEDFELLEMMSSPQKQRIYHPSEIYGSDLLLCTSSTENNWFDNDLVFVELGAPTTDRKKVGGRGSRH